MPTISMFYGIIIRMSYDEHNPPHIHAYYQNDVAVFDIQTATIIEGRILTRQKRLIQAWIEIHQEELVANWNLCQKGEKPFHIQPLH